MLFMHYSNFYATLLQNFLDSPMEASHLIHCIQMGYPNYIFVALGPKVISVWLATNRGDMQFNWLLVASASIITQFTLG